MMWWISCGLANLSVSIFHHSVSTVPSSELRYVQPYISCSNQLGNWRWASPRVWLLVKMAADSFFIFSGLGLHPRSFNITPEKWWLEDCFPFGKVTFQVGMLVVYSFESQWSDTRTHHPKNRFSHIPRNGGCARVAQKYPWSFERRSQSLPWQQQVGKVYHLKL